MRNRIRKFACFSIVMFLTVISCKDKGVLAPGVPTLGKLEVADIENFTARVTSSIDKMGTADITEHGFIFSTSKEERNLDDKAVKKGTIPRTTPSPFSFTQSLSSLEPGKEYFVWAYASTAEGDAFTEPFSFKTKEAFNPAITTHAAENIRHNSAQLKGTLTAKGTYAITEYGLVWSASANPTTSVTTKYSVKGDVTTFPKEFNTTPNNLSPNTTYNFRAYVISNGVTSYGANTTVKTSAINPPAIVTGNADNITVSSARLGGTINTAGTLAITERGVVWGTSANPTTANAKASINGDVTSFPNNFTVDANGLSANTTYNYRAYVIMNGTTTYGDNKTFMTSNILQPGVQTGESKPSSNTAYLTGTLTAAGSHPITEYGLCWGTSANPTTSGSKQAHTGNVTNFPRNFDANPQNLNAGTTYHFRAYVIMNGTTTYGANKSFSTGIDYPHLNTRAATNITYNSATLNATITQAGSVTPSEIGVAFGRQANPIADLYLRTNVLSKNTNGISYPHNYSFNASSTAVFAFTPNTTFYYRAYAVVNGEVFYGGNVSFITLPYNNANVNTTSARTYLDRQGFRVNGSVTSGSGAITRYGFYYTVNVPGSGFDLLQSKVVSEIPNPARTGTFTFSNIIPIYGCGNTIKYRAFVFQAGGNVIYGPVIEFSTGSCVN